MNYHNHILRPGEAVKLLLVEFFPTLYSAHAGITDITTYHAQTMTELTYYSTMYVQMYVKSIVGSPDGAMSCDICETIAGEPDYTSIVGTSINTIQANSLDENQYNDQFFRFNGLSLTDGVQYAIILRYSSAVTLDASNYVQIMRNQGGDSYANGYLWVSFNSGGSWSGISPEDMKLKVLYDE